MSLQQEIYKPENEAYQSQFLLLIDLAKDSIARVQTVTNFYLKQIQKRINELKLSRDIKRKKAREKSVFG